MAYLMMEWYQREIYFVCTGLRQTERQTVGPGESGGGLQCCLSCDSQTLAVRRRGRGGGWSQTQTPRHGSPPDIRHTTWPAPWVSQLTSVWLTTIAWDCGVSCLEIDSLYISSSIAAVYSTKRYFCPFGPFHNKTHWALEFWWSLDLVCKIVGFLSTLTLASQTQLHELHTSSSQLDIQRVFKVSRRDSWRLSSCNTKTRSDRLESPEGVRHWLPMRLGSHQSINLCRRDIIE